MEHKTVVGKILWPQIRFTLNNDITFTPSTLPGTDDHFAKTPSVVIARTAADEKKQGKNITYLLNISYLYQILCNLNGIQGCTLTDLVAREPEGKTTIIAEILADTTYVDIILACCLERHGISQG